MYDNSRVPSYTNVSSRPCRVQYSRWSLNTPSTGITLSQTLPQATTTLSSSSSFYLPQTQRQKQKLTPNYVNLQPLPPSTRTPSSSLLSSYQRPKSTIFPSYTSTDQSTFYVNDPRHRYESKTVVGIVKPMVHQRSYIQLNENHNNNNNNNNNNNVENKFPELMIDSYHHKSTRSLYPPPTPPIPPLPPPPSSSSSSSNLSSVIYRSRPTPSYNNINGPPPQVPRRHSSINNAKYLSSHRSSRSTSTSSSTAALNELSSTISSYENELPPPPPPPTQQQQQHEKNDNRTIIDVKRLEMFYGSVGTLVKSARSVARLYTTTTRQLANFEDWSCQQYGVPIWIYNTGANLKRTRQVRLLLAHHESCFALWSNLISDQAEIRIPKDNHITCWLPDCYVLIVFKFEDDEACRLFFRHYYEILEHQRRKTPMHSSPLLAENTIQRSTETKTNNSSHNHKEIPRRYSRLRTISNKHNKEQQQQEQFQLRRCRSLSKIRTVKKSDISGPINFEHVNHISSGCHRERPLLGTVTLRSLHASMSHLPSNGALMDRCTKSNKNHISTLFQTHTTSV